MSSSANKKKNKKILEERMITQTDVTFNRHVASPVGREDNYR